MPGLKMMKQHLANNVKRNSQYPEESITVETVVTSSATTVPVTNWHFLLTPSLCGSVTVAIHYFYNDVLQMLPEEKTA